MCGPLERMLDNATGKFWRNYRAWSCTEDSRDELRISRDVGNTKMESINPTNIADALSFFGSAGGSQNSVCAEARKKIPISTRAATTIGLW
jgi:hypothetical protein